MPPARSSSSVDGECVSTRSDVDVHAGRWQRARREIHLRLALFAAAVITYLVTTSVTWAIAALVVAAIITSGRPSAPSVRQPTGVDRDPFGPAVNRPVRDRDLGPSSQVDATVTMGL